MHENMVKNNRILVGVHAARLERHGDERLNHFQFFIIESVVF